MPNVILNFNMFFYTEMLTTTMYQLPTSIYLLFADSSVSLFLNYGEFLFLFYFFLVFICLTLASLALLKTFFPTNFFLIKFFLVLFSLQILLRLDWNALFKTFFLISFYWIFLLSSFDDDFEELIELINSAYFFFFVNLIIFLFIKYSIHYFAFLEASLSEGTSITLILKQFLRDFINSFALLLRFFVLIFRLNIYDTLDDFYDSYYVYFGDFDEDEYYDELFFSIIFFYFSYDNFDDKSCFFEEEFDWVYCLFFIYYIFVTKLFFFFFFIIEEILRLTLAFYICYLIIAEVHAVNTSLNESFFFKKKTSLH